MYLLTLLYVDAAWQNKGYQVDEKLPQKFHSLSFGICSLMGHSHYVQIHGDLCRRVSICVDTRASTVIELAESNDSVYTMHGSACVHKPPLHMDKLSIYPFVRSCYRVTPR